MKIAKFFACIFGLLGSALMVFSIGLCLMSLNAPAKILEAPSGALRCSEALMEAACAGDYETAQAMIYGQPDLGVHSAPADQAGIMIWEAFVGSISYEFKGDCYVSGANLARDAVVTAMDIPSVTKNVREKARILMNDRVKNAEDVMSLYDSAGNFRESLVSDVLSEAVVRVLAEDAQMVSRDVTITLIFQDGTWWALPDAALLAALSGGMA